MSFKRRTGHFQWHKAVPPEVSLPKPAFVSTRIGASLGWNRLRVNRLDTNFGRHTPFSTSSIRRLTSAIAAMPSTFVKLPRLP